MKNFSFLFFMMMAAISGAKAYNYQTVYSHRTSLFADLNGKLKTMRVDSVKFNPDSVFYPLKTIRGVDQYCFTPYGASMFGSKIIIRPDYNYLFNAANDTIKIKTNARLNESWIAYSNATVTVTATVERVADTLLFSSIPDSIKIIRFNVQHISDVPYQLNGKKIILSKAFGFIRTFDFFRFPEYNNSAWNPLEFRLAGTTNPDAGIRNLTWFDVFDFQPGDEIHVAYNATPPMGSIPPSGFVYKTKTIMKYLSRRDYTDSIQYTYEVKELTNDTGYVRYTTTSTVKQNPAFNTYPDVPVIFSDNFTNTYNMWVGDVIGKSSPQIGSELIKSENECWRTPITDGCLYSNSYYKGLGGPYYWCSGWGDSYERALVYYKKGTTTWGTPLVINATNNVEAGSGITVYPNITKGKLAISLPANTGGCNFELRNIQGIPVVQAAISSATYTTDISNLANGLYIYNISVQGKILKTGKIVKQ